MSKLREYIRWTLVIILLGYVWRHSYWAVALALTILFVWQEFTGHLTTHVLDDLILYVPEYWRARMPSEEAAIRVAWAQRIYDIARKEQFRTLEKYNDTVKLYEASLKLRPDDIPAAVEEARESLAMAEEKAGRTYENLQAAAGE